MEYCLDKRETRGTRRPQEATTTVKKGDLSQEPEQRPSGLEGGHKGHCRGKMNEIW